MAAPALDSRLAEVADVLERSGWAAELWDPECRLVWVTSELKQTIGEHAEERLGYGPHLLEARLSEAWARTVTGEHSPRTCPTSSPTPRAGSTRCRRWSTRSSGPFGIAAVPHLPCARGWSTSWQGSVPAERVGMMVSTTRRGTSSGL